MKKEVFTIVLFFTVVFFSEILAQEKPTVPTQDRTPAYQNTDSSGGYTEREKAIQNYNDKTVTTRIIEGFNQGMERQEPGSSAAEIGTDLNKRIETYIENTGSKPTSTPSTTKPTSATAQ